MTELRGVLKAAVVFTFVFLAGCGFTSQGNIVRQAISAGTARAAEAGLQNAEWFLCEAAPIGPIKRRYAGDKADAYNKLCDKGSADDIVTPSTP